MPWAWLTVMKRETMTTITGTVIAMAPAAIITFIRTRKKKAVLNRLSRAIGHLQSIKTMVENDRDCSEVLIQLAAVKSAVNNTGKLVLKEHIAHCIVEAIENGDEESLRQLNKAIDSFVK